jgi:WD40 repeat protein
MKRAFMFLLLILFLGILPLSAQDEHCLEVWSRRSDDVRHEINLDTGAVITYTPPEPISTYRNVPSLDGRYTANTETYGTLTLIDNSVGVGIILSEIRQGDAYWSPDSRWLAYIELDTNNNQSLTLYNVDTSERVSSPVVREMNIGTPLIAWSPDGSRIALTEITDLMYNYSTVLIYTVPELAITHTFATEAAFGESYWSPDGNYLAVRGTTSPPSAAALIDITQNQFYTLQGGIDPRFIWSPEGTYLLVSYVLGDQLDEFEVVNMRGDQIFAHIPLDTDFDGTVLKFDWASDHELIASVGTTAGFYDLTFFDVQTGEQRILLPFMRSYALSYDHRHVAALEQNTPETLYFFDLSQDDDASDVTVSEGIVNYLWRDDRLELIVLFQDRSLRGYDYETGTWRDIATVPDDKTLLRLVACVH